jgi:hypothetical protein
MQIEVPEVTTGPFQKETEELLELVGQTEDPELIKAVEALRDVSVIADAVNAAFDDAAKKVQGLLLGKAVTAGG